MMAFVSQNPDYYQVGNLLTKALGVYSIAKQGAVDQVDSCLGVFRNGLLVLSSKALWKKSQQEHQTFYDGVLATVAVTGAESLTLKRGMCCEMERYMLFLHKNGQNYAILLWSKLARAGFFYIGGNNTVQCFSCAGMINSWDHGDPAMGEHKRLYPKCKFVEGTDQKNVPYSGLVDESQKGPDRKLSTTSGAPPSRNETGGSEDASVRISKPFSLREWKPAKIFHGYKPEINRLLSFRRWPITSPVNCYALAGIFAIDVHFQGHSTPPQPLGVEQPVRGSGPKILVGHGQLEGVKSQDGNNRERKPKKGSNQEQVKGKPLRQTSYSWSGDWLRALLVLLLLQPPSVFSTEVCPKNQTTELGRQGSIICHFPDEYTEVHWFDNISETSSPVITYKPKEGNKPNERDKYGQGLDSGTYDVLGDGSLIITNVSTWYERSYKAIVYLEESLTPVTYVISLRVIASPVDDLPMIPCHNRHQEYYHSAVQGDILSCSFNATRPPVQLEWFRKFGDVYEHLEMQQFNTTENSNGTFNSLATIHLLKDSTSFIQLLLCRATWPLSDGRREREILVDFSRNIPFSDVTPKIQHMEINRYAKIQCGQSTSDYVVWKRILPNRGREIIGYHLHGLTETISDIPDVEVSVEGSLIFASPQVHHEGMYVLISGDGQKEEIQMTFVEILILPSPPYIQITGCDDVSRQCVIRENSTKELTCAVYGARPNVTLEWIEEDGEDISFFNHKVVFKGRGETADTILSVEYEVSQNVLCGEEILIKCHLNGPLSTIMKAESTALVNPESCRENEVKEEHGLDGAVITLMVLYGLVLMVIAICLIIYCIGRHLTRSAAAVTYSNGSPTGNPQDGSVQTDTEEEGRQICNGTPLCIVEDGSVQTDTEEEGRQIPNGAPECIVEDTDEECGLMDSKEGSVKDNQDE